MVVASVNIFAYVIVNVIDYAYPKDQYHMSTISEPRAVSVRQENEVKQYGKEVSQDFPATIPLEHAVQILESYSKDQNGQKQVTTVFSSFQRIKENIESYTFFLKKNNWAIVNTLDETNVASVYASRENDEINITVTPNRGGDPLTHSVVSISVLNK